MSLGTRRPDHLYLPDTDGAIAENDQEYPQSASKLSKRRPNLNGQTLRQNAPMLKKNVPIG